MTTPDPPPDRIIRAAELRAVLARSQDTIRRWIACGRLPQPDVLITRATVGWRRSTLRRAERERLRGYFRDALADTGITWPGEVDMLYDKCFGAPYVPDEAA